MVVGLALAAAAAAVSAAAVSAAAASAPASGHPALTRAYADGPPPAHTGGFGEPSCHACHFDAPLNDASGSLEVAVDRGEGEVAVVLSRPGMGAAGFQLSVRFADTGRQAGELVALDDAVEVVEEADSGIQYARQTEAGTALAAPDTARWRVGWRPPPGGGAALVHVAANAANDDASEFGDYIYLAEACVPSGSGRRTGR